MVPIVEADRKGPAELCLVVGFGLLTFVAALVGFTWLGHLASLPLTRLQPVLALSTTLLLILWPIQNFVRLGFRARTFAAAIFVCIIGGAVAIGVSFFDVTCDGQGYHGTGILQLLDGWNPIREPQRADTPQALQKEVMIHYAKGPWLAAAALDRLTGNVEAGKAVGLVLIAACFFLALHAAFRFPQLGFGKAIALALLIAMNPISLSQCLSNYVDGQLATFFTVLLLCSCLQLLERRAIYLVLITVTVVLLVNVKLTAFLYAIVFGIAFLIATYFWKRFAALPGLAAVYAIGLVLALAIGFNPYITNFRETGNPFFPFTLQKAKQGTEENFEVHQMPISFRGRNRFDTFTRSVFGRCQNDYDLSSLTFRGGSLKIPFMVGMDEIETFRDVDTRICGWGPLTSGVLLFALAALFSGERNHLQQYRRMVLPLTLCILATIFIIPHPWYARYVPQLWLLPVMAAVALWLSNRKRNVALGGILIALMFANLLIVSWPNFGGTFSKTQHLRSQLYLLAARNRVYDVWFGDFLLNRLRLQEFGVRYRELSDLPTQGKQMTLAGENALNSKTVVLLGD